MKKIKLTEMLKSQVKESRVGDALIEFGEAIEEIEKQVKVLYTGLGIAGFKGKNEVKHIESAVKRLKELYSNSYSFD